MGGITLPSDPTMAPTPKYSYEFVYWLMPSEITTSDRDYVGQFNAMLRSYDVTFKNGGQVLSTTTYAYGTPAGDITRPADPVKPSDEQCTYTFAGWEPALATVTGAAVYSARFEAVPVEYTVTFVAEGASESKSYPYGTSADAIRPRPDPVKEPDEQNVYVFAGWSPELSDVTGDRTYTAVFLPVTREYTVTFKAGPGGTWSEKHAYNDILTLPDADDPSISGPGRTLTGWEATTSSGGPDAYGPGSEYTVTSDALIAAAWEYSGTGWFDDEDEDYYPRPRPKEGPGTIVFVVAGVATLMSLITAWTVFFYKRD